MSCLSPSCLCTRASHTSGLSFAKKASKKRVMLTPSSFFSSRSNRTAEAREPPSCLYFGWHFSLLRPQTKSKAAKLHSSPLSTTTNNSTHTDSSLLSSQQHITRHSNSNMSFLARCCSSSLMRRASSSSSSMLRSTTKIAAASSNQYYYTTHASLPEEHRMVYDMCRKFADEELAPHATEWDKKHEFPVNAVTQLVRKQSCSSFDLLLI